MWAANGILFNHESPRRGETFVTRKITRGATRIKLGLQEKLFLGNLDAEHDWGFAGDYVEAMWLMVQADQPEDFVIATGVRRSVRQFCELAFSHIDLDWEQYVDIDPIYLRPTEVDALQGDASKAREQLGWKPKVSVEELAAMMVDADLLLAQKERTLADAGFIGNGGRGQPSATAPPSRDRAMSVNAPVTDYALPGGQGHVRPRRAGRRPRRPRLRTFHHGVRGCVNSKQPSPIGSTAPMR